jgi:hypothetical protein
MFGSVLFEQTVDAAIDHTSLHPDDRFDHAMSSVQSLYLFAAAPFRIVLVNPTCAVFLLAQVRVTSTFERLRGYVLALKPLDFLFLLIVMIADFSLSGLPRHCAWRSRGSVVRHTSHRRAGYGHNSGPALEYWCVGSIFLRVSSLNHII